MPIDEHDGVAQIAMFIAVICTVIMGVSRRMGNLLINLLSILLRWSFLATTSELSLKQKLIIDQIPHTIETALDRFNLEAKTTTYAVCPACHCTYSPTFHPGSTDPIYPLKCSNRPSPGSDICDASLLEIYTESGRSKPVKTFVYHHFHDYLAGLLAREDLEMLMDQACDDLTSAIKGQKIPPSFVSDVFEAQFIRKFEGPGKGQLFVERPGTEGRYLFALNVDFFSAEGQTIRGATASCGMISAACLNLPLSVRYQPENMYIAGIIPGPEEPHKTELNHYLRPVVDDLCISWHHGVRFSRTAKHSTGRNTRSAIAIAVNDLPAARKVNQCAHHTSHHYCTRCNCFHLNTVGRTDTDADAWKPKICTSLRQQAEAWKTATELAAQEKIFKEYGVRWTELWRLPYWDPTQMLVVDSMHCLLEGLAQFHFREVLKLTDTSAKEKDPIGNAFSFAFPFPDNEAIETRKLSENDVKHITQIHKLLLSPLDKLDDVSESLEKLTTRLHGKNLNALRYVSDTVGVPPALKRSSKIHYAKELRSWVRSFFQAFSQAAHWLYFNRGRGSLIPRRYSLPKNM